MGSYIGIGFVYNIIEDGLEKELRNLVNYLIRREGSIESIKFSKDEDGNEWVEERLKNNIDIEEFYSLLANGYFGQLHAVCNILNIQKLNVYIRIDKVDKNYFGLLLDISEEELIEESSVENINKVTDRIIGLLNDLYEVSGFNYAFCDNEAEIQYSPIEFQSIDEKVYSIVALPTTGEGKKLLIIKSGWHIDGLTTRMI